MFDLISRMLIHRCKLFFILFAVPILCAFSFLFLRILSLKELENQFADAERHSRIALEKRACKEQFLQRYAQCDPAFLTQRLETLSLLSMQRQELLMRMNHPACGARAALREQLDQCERSSNRLVFIEDANRSSKRTKEMEIHLLHPVEIDLNDLEQILTALEGIPVGSFQPILIAPQCLITNFSLTKREHERYQLELSMLKREFTHD